MNAVLETSSTAQDTDSQDMALAAYAIFSESTNTFKTSLGKPAIIKQATMRQIPVIFSFFQEIAKSLDPHAMASLIDLYSERQKKAAAAGKNPNEVPTGPEEDTETMVGKVLGNVSLLTQLLSATADLMPEVVESFTNLTRDEYEALGVDEGMTIVGGIFMLNWAFFSKNLPPILQACMRVVQQKRSKEAPESDPGPASKPQIRRRK